MNPSYKGFELISGDRWYTMKTNAKVAWFKFVEQEGKCALTSKAISLSDLSRKLKDQTASLDRIDSAQGYVPGNIQWVHKDVNRMKQDFKEQYFIELCRSVWDTECAKRRRGE